MATHTAHGHSPDRPNIHSDDDSPASSQSSEEHNPSYNYHRSRSPPPADADDFVLASEAEEDEEDDDDDHRFKQSDLNHPHRSSTYSPSPSPSQSNSDSDRRRRSPLSDAHASPSSPLNHRSLNDSGPRSYNRPSSPPDAPDEYSSQGDNDDSSYQRDDHRSEYHDHDPDLHDDEDDDDYDHSADHPIRRRSRNHPSRTNAANGRTPHYRERSASPLLHTNGNASHSESDDPSIQPKRPHSRRTDKIVIPNDMRNNDQFFHRSSRARAIPNRLSSPAESQSSVGSDLDFNADEGMLSNAFSLPPHNLQSSFLSFLL